MEKIKELVYDEGNVVTCRNVGIQILNQFLKEEKNTVAQAQFVSGYLSNGVRVATVLSPSVNGKIPIDHVVSEHVYSVGKKAHPTGLLPIEFDLKSKNSRMIKCPHITLRTSEDTYSLRFGLTTAPESNNTCNVEKKIVKSEPVVIKNEKTKMDAETISSSNGKKTIPQKSNNKMANFFSHKPKDPVITNQSKENGKSLEKIKIEEPTKTEKKEDVPKNESKPTGDSTSSPENKFQNIRTYGKKKAMPNNKSKESVKKGEKRKRIRTIDSDDESDPEKDPFASSDEKMDEVDSDNDENIIPATPEVSEKPRIRVVMKTVKKDKVFMGDDDYIHTVKNVCENITEIETSTYSNEIPAKISPKKLKEKDKPVETKKTKKASPTNGPKQGNIMNYFSKK